MKIVQAKQMFHYFYDKTIIRWKQKLIYFIDWTQAKKKRQKYLTLVLKEIKIVSMPWDREIENQSN